MFLKKSIDSSITQILESEKIPDVEISNMLREYAQFYPEKLRKKTLMFGLLEKIY